MSPRLAVEFRAIAGGMPVIRTDLFKSAAPFYVKYRPAYPDELIRGIAGAFRLDGRGRLLDLGCGPGQLLFALAPMFEEAVGMDPDPDMLAEAKREQEKSAIPNVRLLRGGWEDVQMVWGVGPGVPGRHPLRLVTIGAAFHWMKRRSALGRLYPLVGPGGGVAIIDRGQREGDDFHSIVVAVRSRLIGRRRRAGSGFYKKPKLPHERIAELSRFRVGETLKAPLERQVTVEQILGYFYSTSGCSPFVLGDKKEQFEREATEALLAAKPGGVFLERRITEALLLHKD